MSKDPPPSLRNLQSSKFELAQDLDRIIENNSVLSKAIYSSFFKTQFKLKPLALALLIATLCPLSQGDLINSAKAMHTSQTCSNCGHVSAKNRKSQASFVCERCGKELNADLNAALNIKRAGLAQLAEIADS